MEKNSYCYPCVETSINEITYGGQYFFNDAKIILNYSGNSIETFGLCFYLAQAAMRAKDFYKEVQRYDSGAVEIIVHPSSSTTYHNNATGIIHFGMANMNKYFCYQTIIHEYGHHIERYYGSDSILTALNHSFYEPASFFPLNTAWSEGWAHCFAAIVQDNTPSSRRPRIGIYTFKESYYKSYNLERGNHNNEWAIKNGFSGRAKEIECIVAELLWDIYDTRQEPIGSSDYDAFGLTPTGWFRLTTQYDTNTIDGFYKVMKKYYPEDESSFRKMFEERGLL